MKTLIYIALILLTFSCTGYSPNDDFTFTDDVSVAKIDSATYGVTIKGGNYTTKNIDPTLSCYAVDGTEMSTITELDTCIRMTCTQVHVNQVYYAVYYFTFISDDGMTYISLMRNRSKAFEAGTRINLFLNREMLRQSKTIK